jgi:hypothetical protein
MPGGYVANGQAFVTKLTGFANGRHTPSSALSS